MAHRRGPWSQGEDAYLVQLVHTQGALNWVRIAQLIGSRSPKQCRERYHQNLKPSLNHEPISPEEGLQIERLVGEMGKRWAEIARRLHGRSDNAVKNWWNGSMNRRRRLVRRRTSAQYPGDFDEQSQPLAFARPAAPRPLTINHFTHRRSVVEGPLPSPAASENSRAESVEGPPSLMSDCGSTFSVSPRLAGSPGIELPPLNRFARHENNRRPSLPMLHFPSSSTFRSELDNQAYASRFPSDTKVYPMSAPSYAQSKAEMASSPSPREFSNDCRIQLLSAPPTPVYLPPLQMATGRTGHPKQLTERDSRMRLSSLLI